MPARFVAAAVLVLAAVVLEPIPVVAQNAPCDADPRWMVVTVVQAEAIDHESNSVRTFDHLAGLRILDRCRIVHIAELVGNESAAAQIQMRHDAISDTTQLLLVKEPVQDICMAMRDCGDATLPARLNSPTR